jgi:beta-lactamase regulating signal transducer with metallopeptidase domain/HEAT repeat protein
MTFTLGTGTAGALAILIIKVTLLLVVALGASALLQRASAGARHLVWVAVVGALLLLPALAAWSPVRLEILPAATAAAIAAPASQAAAHNAAAPAPPTTPSTVNEAASPEATRAAQEGTFARISGWRIAASIWAVIALGVAAWLVLGFLAVRRIVRNARRLEEREWTGPLYEIADRLGIDATPRLMRSDAVKMPFACGLVTPTIILPAESERWDPERRRAVLMHELAHVRRRDLVGHTLGRLACALYWFHPLVWTAVRRLRIESERACDDLALTCGLRASNYAEHLLDIVSHVGKTRTPAIAIPMAHRREFEGRMLAILDPELRRRTGRRQSVVILAGLFALVVVVGGAVPAERVAGAQREVPQLSQADTDNIAPQDVSLGTLRLSRERSDTQERKQVSRQQSRVQVDPPPPVRDEIEHDTDFAQVLGQDTTRNDRATLLINVLRSDSSASLRRVAAWGLSRYAERPEAGSALATALRRDGNAAVREMAAWALAHGGERADVVAALAEAVRRDADNEVRATSAWALGNVDAEAAVDALSDAISGQPPRLRALAIWALGNASPKSAPRGLLNALGDSDEQVRMLAAWALYRIEDPESVPALEQALNREQDRDVRMGYIRALGAIGERSSSALARLIDSRDPEVRAVVVEALAGKGGGPWPWPWPMPRPSP